MWSFSSHSAGTVCELIRCAVSHWHGPANHVVQRAGVCAKLVLVECDISKYRPTGSQNRDRSLDPLTVVAKRRGRE